MVNLFIAILSTTPTAITSTYMTTATLPCRYEIENLDTTSTDSTLKQICSTVLSEGGYDLRW
jgi:hypothetical protein